MLFSMLACEFEPAWIDAPCEDLAMYGQARELALKWIDAPCEDPAPECGHVIERKDSAHDRSEQVLCNRL